MMSTIEICSVERFIYNPCFVYYIRSDKYGRFLDIYLLC